MQKWTACGHAAAGRDYVVTTRGWYGVIPEQATDIAYLFLDTNICLHYQSFVSVPWADLVNKPVCLVFCSTVINELDRKKFEAPHERIRNRAKKVLSLLEAALEGNQQLPKNTRVMDYMRDNIDWQQFNLAPDVGDDRIIGQLLCFKAENGSPDVRIVTADTGLRLKARAFGIAVVRMPDEYRLQGDDEAAVLRREVEKYRNRMPKLSFGFLVGDKALDHIEIEVEYIPAMRPQISVMRDFLTARGISPVKAEQLVKYALDILTWKRLNARTIELRFVVENHGSAPAEDVQILIDIPDVGVVREKRLEPPKPPEDPWIRAISRLDSAVAVDVSPYGWGEPKLLGDRLEMPYWLGKLKHQLREELQPLYIIR